jgi:hypothetical protein
MSEKLKRNAQKPTKAFKEMANSSAEKGKRVAKKVTSTSKNFAKRSTTAAKSFVTEGATTTAEKCGIFAEYLAGRAAELSAFFAQADILKWTKEITEKVTHGTATIYDKALDAEYIRTHIGGGHHRFFDGGHDLMSAWEKAKEASTDDTFVQEVIGYSTAIWKDLVTKMGLPFATLEKASFDNWADKVTEMIPGVNKAYLYDLLSFDVMELFSTGLGAVGVIFCFNKRDQEKLSEILSAMGIQSIIAANPVMGFFVISVTAYAYFVKKTKFNKVAMFKSGTVAAVSASLFAIMGMPILIELVIVISLTYVFRKKILDNEKLVELIKNNTQTARQRSNNLVIQVTSQFQKLAKQKHYQEATI